MVSVFKVIYLVFDREVFQMSNKRESQRRNHQRFIKQNVNPPNFCQGSIDWKDAWESTSDVNTFCSIEGFPLARDTFFRPLVLPTFLQKPLASFHGDPGAWWSGQLLFYLMRPRASLISVLKEYRAIHFFKHPIVG